ATARATRANGADQDTPPAASGGQAARSPLHRAVTVRAAATTAAAAATPATTTANVARPSTGPRRNPVGSARIPIATSRINRAPTANAVCAPVAGSTREVTRPRVATTPAVAT